MEDIMLVVSYVIYICLSITITVWVAKTLHKNGGAFLIDAFENNSELASSINHLLVVGFYLINLGYMSYHLKTNIPPQTWAQLIETLSAKIGIILLVLGAMHFFNIYVLNKMRNKGLSLTTVAKVQ
jgi:hypothetical protein